MRLRELKNGTWITDRLHVDSPLDTHNGIAAYLASDTDSGHVLLHILPDFEDMSLNKVENSVKFHREALNIEAQGGRFEEFLYFSEPFPLGEFLFEWLERRERVGIAVAIKRVIKVLHVLQKAHECGIYHGRITPKSILIERSGETFDLRLMGLGISQAMTESLRLDIDWLDYTFDLEGMKPEAVDIYGMAIILMGLVSGEQGIDGFESTGLLPPVLRGGILQQAMERALALRMDSYNDVLGFSLDLEAALLELDAKEGEVYVGDLVGFESAIKSISSISEDSHVRENSGVWSNLVGTLEQEERSSLLCSLTSLTSIKAIDADDDDEEDITRVSSVPQAVLGLRRIKSGHSESGDVEKTNVLPQPKAIKTSSGGLKSVSGSYTAQDKKIAELQSYESRLSTETEDEEDDSPTRVVMRPNYLSISFGTKQDGVSASIAEVLQETAKMESPIPAMVKRIHQAEVTESTHSLKHDVFYDVPEEPEPPAEGYCAPKPEELPPPGGPISIKTDHSEPDSDAIQAAKAKKIKIKRQQRKILIMSIIVILILLVILISKLAMK